METFAFKWGVLAFLLSCFLPFSRSMPLDVKVKGVNLGGWLVVEGWMTPDISGEIRNNDLLDGRQLQFRSVALNTYVTAENKGGSTVSVNRTIASGWETFRLWRVSATQFKFRSPGGQFLSCDGEGSSVTAMGISPSDKTTFQIERNEVNPMRVHIKLQDGSYLQATDSSNQLIAINGEAPEWDDNVATFEMVLVEVNVLGGEYQIANGFAPDDIKAKEVFEAHRSSFVTEEDFSYLSQNGINTVRIPVGWWIYKDPNPPFPYVGGSLAALDNAFTWAAKYKMRCIIDLHAAPGSQNEWDHSSTRDGFSIDWPKPENINESLQVIEFLADRYSGHPALFGIELLNEPKVDDRPVLLSYYSEGYKIVQHHAPNTYVIICQRVGTDGMELFDTGEIDSSFLVVDLHKYNAFDREETSTKANIDRIRTDYLKLVQNGNGANGGNGPLVFIGEWANEMTVIEGPRKPDSDYIDFGKAQLEVYNQASFGWAYWSLKLRNDKKNRWSLKWNIDNGFLQLGGPSNK